MSIGVPRDPEVVFHEDFETDQAPAGSISSIVNYVGSGEHNRNGDQVSTFRPMTMASGWGMISECNGTIVNYNFSLFPRGTGSGNSAWPGYDGFCTNAGAGTDLNRANTRADMQNNARRFADVLGQVEQGIVGSTNQNSPVNESNEASRANHAVTEWTSLTPITTPTGSQTVVYRTGQMDLSNRTQPDDVERFYLARIDVAEASCGYLSGTNHSRLRMFLLTEDDEDYQVSGGYIEPCINTGVNASYYTSGALPTTRTSLVNSGYGSGGPSVRAGRYLGDTARLVPNGPMREADYRLLNATTAADGNDFAFDNLVLLDATPRLEKTFETNGLDKPRGGSTRLTFTVTNTSDLAAKPGWSFTDTLPNGLRVASSPEASHTCGSGTTINAAADATAISIADGNLTQGMASCTISVNVVSDVGGEFENCAANITEYNGLDVEVECTTVTYSWLAIDKASSAGADSEFEDLVTYTVNFTNDGPNDYTAANPAGITDDLSDVLDDATWIGNITIAFDGGTTGASLPVFNAATQELTWSGPLQAGETATFTYQVELHEDGDRTVHNVVCVDGVDDLCDETTTSLPPRINLTIDKSANRTSLPTGTRNVDYTVIVTNHGPAAATGANEVVMVDDLSDVLDDANWVSTSFPARPNASYTSPSGSAAAPVFDDATETLTWTGPLEAGQSVEITYRVSWRGTGTSTLGGSGHLYNVACIPEDLTREGDPSCAEVNISGPNTTWKTSDPASGTELVAGDEVTYTLHFDKRSGTLSSQRWDLDYTDHLGDVLDDAEFVAGSLTVSNSAITADFDSATSLLSVSGRLQGSGTNNQEHTVSYTVKVKPDAERGDNVMANFLMPKDNPPPEECVPAGNELPNCTTHPIDDPDLSTFLIEKHDATDALVAGAGFEINEDDNGSVGTLVTDPEIVDLGDDPTNPESGRFSVTGLPAGDYWLTETTAPDGHTLLAEPVQFTLAADGTITIGGTNPQVTAATNGDNIWVITVRDNAALPLPMAGGQGTLLFTAGGIALLLIAGAIVYANTRRKTTTTSPVTP